MDKQKLQARHELLKKVLVTHSRRPIMTPLEAEECSRYETMLESMMMQQKAATLSIDFATFLITVYKEYLDILKRLRDALHSIHFETNDTFGRDHDDDDLVIIPEICTDASGNVLSMFHETKVFLTSSVSEAVLRDADKLSSQLLHYLQNQMYGKANILSDLSITSSSLRSEFRPFQAVYSFNAFTTPNFMGVADRPSCKEGRVSMAAAAAATAGIGNRCVVCPAIGKQVLSHWSIRNSNNNPERPGVDSCVRLLAKPLRSADAFESCELFVDYLIRYINGVEMEVESVASHLAQVEDDLVRAEIIRTSTDRNVVMMKEQIDKMLWVDEDDVLAAVRSNQQRMEQLRSVSNACLLSNSSMFDNQVLDDLTKYEQFSARYGSSRKVRW